MRHPKPKPQQAPAPEPVELHPVGYARVSTEDQNLDMQIAALRRAGVHPSDIWQEKVSGRARRRPQFASMMKDLRAGDILVVWKLDRIARSMRGVLEVIEKLDAKGVKFRSLTEHIDLSSPLGALVLHIMAAVAEFEVSTLRERTRAGLAAARERGRIGGRRERFKEADIRRAWDMIRDGATWAKARQIVKDDKGAMIGETRLRSRIQELEQGEKAG